MVRCEIQAMDQHWSSHRLAISLPDRGFGCKALARDMGFHQASSQSNPRSAWPVPVPCALARTGLQRALERELTGEVAQVRVRQENSLRRELERIDDYFENYERELINRTKRSSNKSSKVKMADRLAAAKAEHVRRRADQVLRHEIRVYPQVDATLLFAEKAWRAPLQVEQARQQTAINALFVPRSRRWAVERSAATTTRRIINMRSNKPVGNCQKHEWHKEIITLRLGESGVAHSLAAFDQLVLVSNPCRGTSSYSMACITSP